MRKLGILVMALVLVVGMSSGVMADMGDHSVGVTLTVAEYAQIDMPDDYDITLTKPNGEFNGSDQDRQNVTIRNNTDIKATFSWSWNQDNYPGVDEWDGSGDSDYTISPNIVMEDTELTFEETGTSDAKGRDGTVLINNKGEKTFGLRLESKWSDSGNHDWETLEAGDYEGTLTITIEGQDS